MRPRAGYGASGGMASCPASVSAEDEMLRMAVGHSDELDPVEAIGIAIDQCRASLDGARPQAGLLLASFHSFEPAVVDAVRQAFPGIRVVGSTSAAEVSSLAGYAEDSIMLAVFAVEGLDVTVGFAAGLDEDADAVCRTAAGEARSATTMAPRLAIVLADAFTADPQRIAVAMSRALPDGVLVVGGGSARSELNAPVPTHQFCDERVGDDAVAVLLFSGDLAFSVAIGTGWRTLGVQGTVTAARGGLIDTIDGRPANEFLAPYLDVTGPPAFGNPLTVVEPGATQSYLRAILGADPGTGAVRVHGGVPLGAAVQLSTAGTDDILAGTRDALGRARDAFPPEVQPEAALVFSCMIRKYLLGTRTRIEADMAREVFGPGVPVAGLYCAGEIAPIGADGSSRFLNETFVTVLVGS
jgi:hypothetical protein